MRRTNVKRALRVLALLGCLSVIVAVPAAFAQEEEEEATSTPSAKDELPAAEAENGQLWFVELKSEPEADGTSPDTLKREKDDFRDKAKKAGVKLKERYAFDTLWNGLSVEVDKSQVGKLRRLDGVNAVYPVAKIPLPEVRQEDPELATALAMTGADAAQSELGYTGEGVKVAVMDTGIDYHHPDLGEGFGSDKRVFTGHDFVGDAFDGSNALDPDEDPDDCNGHGTHVAGIVGANGQAKGVAPGVTFGAYKVFGCDGSTTADVMIAAMERVLADGMDVLNMSIGSAFQWPQYPTAQASDRLVNKGVSVVASIGNSGANGLYSAGAPGVGKKVIGVSSFDNTHLNDLPYFTISPDGKAIGYLQASAAADPPTSGSSPMARTGTATSTADACTSLPAGSLAGKVALIRRGTCTFYQKALNAQNAGAVGVVLYNNAPGYFSSTVEGTSPITIPVVTISDTDGVLINDRLAGSVDMTWTDQTAQFPNATGELSSSFSSYGLSPDLALKPDIGAPGGFIRSTYPVEKGSYATLSGTSMSSPHVAGGAALLLEARPDTSPQVVRDILQNSADPKRWWGNPGSGFLDNVHRQGAGMLDIDDAILSETEIEPGKLSLGESETGPATKTLTIENSDSSDVTYDLSHAPALSTGPNTFTPGFSNRFATVTFSSESVTVPAGGTATVGVTITPPATLADKSQYGGYIVLTPEGGGQTYRVPYAGFKGDYQSIQVLAPTARNFPWLAKRSGTDFKQADGATFTMATGDDIPYVLVHLDHQARELRIEVEDANTGKSWHRAIDTGYLPRNSTSNGFFALPIDGTTTSGNKKSYTLPDGQYGLKLSVQKALGDDNNPAHWETWTSPPFTIDRP